MKKINRSARLLILALTLLTLTAQAQISKDEVVYALLSPGGEPESLYVVNGFEAEVAAEGSDFGAYREVLLLSEAERFSYEGAEVSFAMAEGRFYYQGIPEGKQLPWEIKLRYTLDGAETSPEALAGASGKLGVFFSVTPRPEGAAYNQSLAMNITLALPGARCFNIQADKATLAYAGGDVALSYVILPGQGAAYSVFCDVQDFAMPGAQFAAVRMGVDVPMYQSMAAKALEDTPFALAASGMMERFLAGMTGQPAVSFMDSRNAVRSLQFVLLTRDIQTPKPAPDIQPDAQEETPSGLWQRILGLFGDN